MQNPSFHLMQNSDPQQVHLTKYLPYHNSHYIRLHSPVQFVHVYICKRNATNFTFICLVFKPNPLIV